MEVCSDREILLNEKIKSSTMGGVWLYVSRMKRLWTNQINSWDLSLLIWREFLPFPRCWIIKSDNGCKRILLTIKCYEILPLEYIKWKGKYWGPESMAFSRLSLILEMSYCLLKVSSRKTTHWLSAGANCHRAQASYSTSNKDLVQGKHSKISVEMSRRRDVS